VRRFPPWRLGWRAAGPIPNHTSSERIAVICIVLPPAWNCGIWIVKMAVYDCVHILGSWVLA
jgi:hypothetical protein